MQQVKFQGILLLVLFTSPSIAQTVRQFNMYDDVKVTLDIPKSYPDKKKTIIILYALPNGNSTEQTMGKKIKEGEDWHFDIQHIKAQTAFVRNELEKQNIVVGYLENSFKSWPAWKTKHTNYILEVQHITDTILSLFSAKEKVIYLNGHSGGGRFIFSFLDGVKEIPSYIERISFLDSDYGYEAAYLPKIKSWLRNKKAYLNVFAYNDSVALLNGKRFVSDTGGTWYRSYMMLRDLSQYFHFEKKKDDSLIIYQSADKRIQFFFKTNPEKKIFHTVQVELNGFIHSVLMGTKRESKRYAYFGERAYKNFIE
ncbi:MAG TPA: hypothetical protein VMY77_01995 [Chitinophagaceae bacterium]|nr:hypothetical protein [Chitinophagaceae bacterium]